MAKYHDRPVHFNRGRHGSVWICIACGKQLAGPSLPLDEKEALIQFAQLYSNEIKTAKAATALQEHKGEKVMKLEIAMLVGPEAKGFLANLTAQLDRMEKLTGAAATTPATTSKKATAPVTDEDEDTTVETEDDEDFAPSKKKTAAKKAAASFDADEDDATAETEEDEGFIEKAPAKKAAPKAKKITIDDVNDACKKRATGGRRDEVLNILKKKFKTVSVQKIDEAQWPAVIAAMAE